MRTTLFWVTLFITNNICAKNTSDTIKKSIFAIKNYEYVVLNIEGMDKATYQVEKSITILNEKAKDLLTFYEFVDDFRKIDDVSIKLYDGLGKLQESYTKRDLEKQSFNDALVGDNYVFYKEATTKSYPCTINISYEIKYKGFLYFPDFRISTSGIGAEKLSYTINCKKNDINYKLYGTTQKPVITEGDGKTYKWEFTKIPPQVYEERTDDDSRLHAIKISPRQFSLDGQQGEFSSWTKFGEWYHKLSAEEKSLSTKEKNEILNLVAGISDKKQKAAIIYNYLQKNYRYVSIQLGIGGYKPISASFTHQKKYGDCKALSNYMQAALAVVEVPSYQALINSGINEPPVDETFPIHQFNHVILCVPVDKDTLWLECTSNTNDFNTLGAFTENRKALLITETGGVLVNTPKSIWQNNIFSSNTILDPSLEENNTILKIKCTGENKNNFLHYINETSDEKRLKYFQFALSAKQPDNFNVAITENEYTFNLHYNKLQEFNAGSKYFYSTSIFPIMDETMPDDNKRTLPFYFDYPYQNNDTVVFILGDTYAVESLPEAHTISNQHFNYSTKSIEDKANKTLRFIHSFTLKSHIIPPTDFNNLKKSFALIKEQMAKKLVLKKIS